MASLLNMSSSSLLNKGSLLPSGYTQVEYIENTSTAYIAIDVSISNTDNFQIKAKTINFKSGNIFGGRKSATDSNVEFNIGSTGHYQFDYYDYRINRIDFDLAKQGDFIVFSFNNNVATFNGKNYSVKNSVSFETPKIWLFNIYNAYSPRNCFLGRVYQFMISNKCNLIPCINPNNVVGMYDLVEGKFYSSPNGVAFVAGPVVS